MGIFIHFHTEPKPLPVKYIKSEYEFKGLKTSSAT